jgi:hypothetical protein
MPPQVIQNQEFQSVVMNDAEKFSDVSEARFVPLDLITPIDKSVR